MDASLVFYSDAELLEGPVFDAAQELLYFVSIFDHLVYCYNPKTKEMLSVKLDSPVSCIFLLSKKKVLCSAKEGFYEINFENLQKKLVFQLPISKEVRYNDGIQDSRGRILIGTMGYPEVVTGIGTVFSHSNGATKTLIKNTTISNGMAFTQDDKFLYFIDTPTKKVAKYHYNIDNGEATFDSFPIHFGRDEGSPDGMCMDTEGMLWIAEWGGGCISKWDPRTGAKLESLALPCENVTSCCFDNSSNLYVTTAKSDSKAESFGGGLFYVELKKSRPIAKN